MGCKADRWNHKIQKTTVVKLAKPVSVILFFLTALPEFDGRFHFRIDVYSRDEAVLEDLNAAFIQTVDWLSNRPNKTNLLP